MDELNKKSAGRKLNTVPNQKIIQISARTARNKENTYSTFNTEAAQTAMNLLKGEAFKMWFYLNKNQEGYQLELSQKAVEDWGIKKDAYYAAVNRLIEVGYLQPVRANSNIFSFSEKPKEQDISYSEKPKSNEYDSEKQNEFSEIPKDDSEKPNKSSEKPKEPSEIPWRNNTNNTNNKKDNTITIQSESFDFLSDFSCGFSINQLFKLYPEVSNNKYHSYINTIIDKMHELGVSTFSEKDLSSFATYWRDNYNDLQDNRLNKDIKNPFKYDLAIICSKIKALKDKRVNKQLVSSNKDIDRCSDVDEYYIDIAKNRLQTFIKEDVTHLIAFNDIFNAFNIDDNEIHNIHNKFVSVLNEYQVDESYWESLAHYWEEYLSEYEDADHIIPELKAIICKFKRDNGFFQKEESNSTFYVNNNEDEYFYEELPF